VRVEIKNPILGRMGFINKVVVTLAIVGLESRVAHWRFLPQAFESSAS
jgi:hypothetical protein